MALKYIGSPKDIKENIKGSVANMPTMSVAKPSGVKGGKRGEKAATSMHSSIFSTLRMTSTMMRLPGKSIDEEVNEEEEGDDYDDGDNNDCERMESDEIIKEEIEQTRALNILQKILNNCPGFVCVYLEIARIFASKF